MSKTTDGGPAFPWAPDGPNYQKYSGMTLRDWFAGQAIAGLMASNFNEESNKLLSCIAYELADAMIAQRASSGSTKWLTLEDRLANKLTSTEEAITQLKESVEITPYAQVLLEVEKLKKVNEELELKLTTLGNLAVANWDASTVEEVDKVVDPHKTTYNDNLRTLFKINPEKIKKLEQENADLRAALNTALAIEFIDDKIIVELIKRLITIKEQNDLQRSN